jgi:hypothetical protein
MTEEPQKTPSARADLIQSPLRLVTRETRLNDFVKT